jgi:cellulose synthase/poly-beta-1,6-N-acetylglucosamine synthase-like glycosyltransferase
MRGYSVLGSGSFYMQVCKYKRRKSARLQTWGIPPEQWPRVDVLIPCFNEPVADVKIGYGY